MHISLLSLTFHIVTLPPTPGDARHGPGVRLPVLSVAFSVPENTVRLVREKISKFTTVALSFLFDKYCPIMN